MIGSDGLFEMMSNYEIINFISSYYDSKRTPHEAADALMERLKRSNNETDNPTDDITFIIIFLIES